MSAVQLGKGLDAAALSTSIAEGKKFPLAVTLTNDYRAPVVIAQAQPILVLGVGETKPHTCQTPAHLYDVVFGMIAVADRLGQDIIGSIESAAVEGVA